MRPARPLVHLVAPLLLTLLAACASSSSEIPPPPAVGAEETSDQTRLAVDNGSSLDMDVFLVRSGQRIRIGLAPAGQSTTFELNRGHTAGAGNVHFVAVPVRGGGQPYEGEPANIRQGETVTLRIPAQ